LNDYNANRILDPIEGNPNRDLWKYVCWKSSKMEGINHYERALFSVLSGNLAAVLPLCTSWTDKLWAYFK
jgi:nuclear pore complex protein Nup107